MNKVKLWLTRLLQPKITKKSFDLVDESSEESFPASDSPAWAGFEQAKPIPKLNPFDPIALLKEEHQLIMEVIYLIHEQVEHLESNRRVDTEHLEEIIEFMRAFVDKGHHHKEEDFLFPALEQSGAPLADCPLDSFRQDHLASLSLLENMEATVKRYEKHEEAARAQLISILNELKDIYTRHTLKEENFVFPLAEKYLSKGAQKTLCAQFDKVDAELSL